MFQFNSLENIILLSKTQKIEINDFSINIHPTQY